MNIYRSDFIKTYSPYIFVIIALSFFGLWSNKNLQSARTPERSIASDCNSMMSEIIAPSAQDEKLYKLKNKTWNKVMGPHDFENFNDQEYFRWLEIYKDGNEQLSNINPVSIEQKMALIEVINKRLIHNQFYSEKKISEEIHRVNIQKLKKLQSHMRSFDMKKKLTKSDLHNFAADLIIILKGPPVSLMDYFINNKTARMNTKLMKMVQEDILLMGLKGMLERLPEKNSTTSLEAGRYIVKNFFFHKLWKDMIGPDDLSWFEKFKIPEELLQNIMIDGLETHDQELIEHLKAQNMIDHYEHFRKVYKPIAFSIGFYFYFEKYNNDLTSTSMTAEDNVSFKDFFKNLSDIILDKKTLEDN